MIKCLYFVIEHTIPIILQYLVQSFFSLVVKIRELYELIITSFFVFWNKTQIKPIKEHSTVMTSRRIVLGSVGVILLVIEGLIC